MNITFVINLTGSSSLFWIVILTKVSTEISVKWSQVQVNYGQFITSLSQLLSVPMLQNIVSSRKSRKTRRYFHVLLCLSTLKQQRNVRKIPKKKKEIQKFEHTSCPCMHVRSVWSFRKRRGEYSLWTYERTLSISNHYSRLLQITSVQNLIEGPSERSNWGSPSADPVWNWEQLPVSRSMTLYHWSDLLRYALFPYPKAHKKRKKLQIQCSSLQISLQISGSKYFKAFTSSPRVTTGYSNSKNSNFAFNEKVDFCN